MLEYSFDTEIETHGSAEDPRLSEIYMRLYEQSGQQDRTERKDVLIPISVFCSGISGLRAIVKFLKEENGMRPCDISRILNRDQRTIWSAYDAAKDEAPYDYSTLSSDTIHIKASSFAARKESVLETVCSFLASRGFTLTEAAKLLHKSPKTVWTALHRSKAKQRRKQR